MARITEGTEKGTPIELHYEDHGYGPHNIGWTHPEECNKALLEFLTDDHEDGRVGSALAAAGRRS